MRIHIPKTTPKQRVIPHILYICITVFAYLLLWSPLIFLILVACVLGHFVHKFW